MKKSIFTFGIVTLLSMAFLWVGHNMAKGDVRIFKNSTESASAKVLTIDSTKDTPGDNFTSTVIIFRAEIINGPRKGQVVKAYQEHNSQVSNMKKVRAGDKVIIKNYPVKDLGVEWAVDNYRRTPAIFWLLAIFAVLVVAFGRTKGIRTIISLLFTCLAVFFIFIPSVLSGKNIYISSIVVCVYIIIMTLVLVNGIDKKTFCSIFGCIGGVLAAAIIAVVMNKVMLFTGYTNEDSYYLTMLPNPVNLTAISFAAIIIGAVGAVLDVAMSIASSLYEMTEKIPDIDFKSLVSSGFAIGRDMMGTMSSTLVLAYIGSSMSSVLLFLTYADSMADVINREMIAYDILQAIAGSLGILLAIPLTTIVCGFVYIKFRGKHE